MAREITMQQLLEGQAEMNRLVEELAGAKTPDEIQRIAKALEVRGTELAQLGAEFERQELAKIGPQPRGDFEVVLTAAQRERIREQTGVVLESVVLSDPSGTLMSAMPRANPAFIEQYALEQAQRLKAVRETEGLARAEVQRILDDLERHGGAIERRVKELRADPRFLDGILIKK